MRLPILLLLGAMSLLLSLVLAPLPAAHAAPAPAFQLATTSDPHASYIFKWFDLIYTEAFRRLGLRIELSVYPTQRIGVLLDQGSIDGEVGRARIYAEVHPGLIRVEESVLDVAFALYTANPALAVSRLDGLRGSNLTAGYRRGVVYCERELQSVLPAAQITDVTKEEQGLHMLISGRIDVFCGMDTAVWAALASPSFKGTTVVRHLMTLQLAPLYPFLLGKHAEQAPKLAAALKAMKAEGLIERYRLQALREFGP